MMTRPDARRRSFAFGSALCVLYSAVWILLIGCAAAQAPAPPAAAPRQAAASAQPEESWDALILSGARVGYVHSVTRRVADPEPMVVTTVFHELALNRFGVTLRMRSSEEYRESPQGALLCATSTNSDPGVSASSALTIQAGKATLTTRTGDTTHVADIPWAPEVIGPDAVNRKVRETGFAPGKETTFTTYDAELQRITHCSVKIQGSEVVTIEGKPRDLHKGEMRQDIVPGVAMQVWLDDNGEALKSVTALLGGVETLRVSREEALRAAAPGSLPDLEKQLQITSDKVIERPGAVTEALYRIEGPTEKLTLEDRRQKIEDHGPGWVLLRVKALADAPERSPEKPGPECLAPSAYLQSDDADIARAAREAAGAETRPADVARALTAWVYDRIVKKDYEVGFTSAKEALLSREGDCTQHAVLLAALLRAKQIPSRVAVGVTYWKGAFVYHMWTEAFLNDWTALDATLKAAPVDATHIKLIASPLETASAAEPLLALVQAMGNLKIKVEEVKGRGSQER
jgi:transglutaminase-like putative cysteine protease